MIKTLSLTVIFLIASSVYAQEIFHVLHISGKVSIDSSEVSLNVGDVFQGNHRFVFSSDKDKVLLLSNERGRMVLFPREETPTKKQSELAYYLHNNILPVQEYTATRSDDTNAILLFFKNGTLYVPKKIKVSHLPENANSGYMLEFISDSILSTKKLNITPEGFLLINADVFNKTQRVSITALNYFDANTQSTINLELQFKIISLETIQEELNTYKKLLHQKGLADSQVKDELSIFLEDTYGTYINLGDFNDN